MIYWVYNVLNAGKPSTRSYTSFNTRELTQERSHMNVPNVGKNSTTNQPSTAIREFTGEGT